MTDAELMTTEATVPGLEVELSIQEFRVYDGGIFIGRVVHHVVQARINAQLIARNGEERWNTKDNFPTRNEAVKWILDQHEKGEK